jgi:hypothetical protein
VTLETRLHRAAEGIRNAVEAKEDSMRTSERSRIEHFDRFRTRKDRRRAVGAIVLVVIAMIAIGLGAMSALRDARRGRPAETGTSSATAAVGTVSISDAGCAFAGDMTPGAGPLSLEITNDTSDAITVQVFKIANDARFARMVAFVRRTSPRKGTHDWARMWDFPEAANTTESNVPAHDSTVVSAYLDGGTYGIICFTDQPAERYRPSDLIGPIDASSQCPKGGICSEAIDGVSSDGGDAARIERCVWIRTSEGSRSERGNRVHPR